jgi:uncharacterized protein (DUF433 family)
MALAFPAWWTITLPRATTGRLPENSRAPSLLRMKQWSERIESDPQVLRGKPCIKGTRIPVALILGYLAALRTIDQIIQQSPGITAADIAACLEFARDLADFESIAAA